jgi:hypothetical protein
MEISEARHKFQLVKSLINEYKHIQALNRAVGAYATEGEKTDMAFLNNIVKRKAQILHEMDALLK